jgi:hypothetical protein
VDVGGKTLRNVITLTPVKNENHVILSPPIVAEAGRSREFHVLPPVDIGVVWRLRCQVYVEDAGMGALRWRVRRAWQSKSLGELYPKTFHQWRAMESQLITNAVLWRTKTPAR